MATFRFKLASVLQQRLREERQLQRVVAERQAQLATLTGALERLGQAVESSNREARQHRLTGALDLGWLAAHRRFVLAMRQQGIQIVQKISLAQRQVEEAVAQLAEAAKRRKTIEKLRERQFAHWRQALEKKRQTELDEAGMQIAFANLSLDAEGAT